MKYLKKVFFFNPQKSESKVELYISSDCIDFLTWYKLSETAEGTMLHCLNKAKEMNHIIDGVPENVNQIVFDGLFFKATCHYVTDGGGMKKFSAWINPDNIICIYTRMPDDCQVCFSSGAMLLITNKLPDVLKAIFEHNKILKERWKKQYGK
jgi:hypothetical protein